MNQINGEQENVLQVKQTSNKFKDKMISEKQQDMDSKIKPNKMIKIEYLAFLQLELI